MSSPSGGGVSSSLPEDVLPAYEGDSFARPAMPSESSGFTNFVSSPRKRSGMLSLVSPFLCFAMLTYLMSLRRASSSSFLALASMLYMNITMSASCSMAPDSRRSMSEGLPSIRRSCESAMTGTSSSFAIIFKSLVMDATSCTLFSSPRFPLDMSCI